VADTTSMHAMGLGIPKKRCPDSKCKQQFRDGCKQEETRVEGAWLLFLGLLPICSTCLPRLHSLEHPTPKQGCGPYEPTSASCLGFPCVRAHLIMPSGLDRCNVLWFKTAHEGGRRR
jgi:hypothetical protein